MARIRPTLPDPATAPEDRYPRPPGLVGKDFDGNRVKSLPFALFVEPYPEPCFRVAACLDAAGPVNIPHVHHSTGELAVACDMSIRSIQRAVSILVDGGWLYIEVLDEDTKPRRNLYWMLWRVPPPPRNDVVIGVEE